MEEVNKSFFNRITLRHEKRIKQKKTKTQITQAKNSAQIQKKLSQKARQNSKQFNRCRLYALQRYISIKTFTV